MLSSLKSFEKSIQSLESQFSTQVPIYVGHEYTKGNLEFSKSVLPHKKSILTTLQSLPSQTIPTFWDQEKQINPFLMTLDESLIKALDAESLSESEVLGKIRARKDDWKGVGV